VNQTTDGTIDYSRYTRAQLLDALTRIDGNRYPLNFQALNRELAVRPTETTAHRPSRALPFPIFVVWNATVLSMLLILSGLALGLVQTLISGDFDRLLHGTVNRTPPTGTSLLIRLVTTIAITFGFYMHLAAHRRSSYRKLGVWVAVAVSVPTPLFAYLDPVGSRLNWIVILALNLALNLLLFFLAGWWWNAFPRDTARSSAYQTNG
jgi:hypothetical protein